MSDALLKSGQCNAENGALKKSLAFSHLPFSRCKIQFLFYFHYYVLHAIVLLTFCFVWMKINNAEDSALVGNFVRFFYYYFLCYSEVNRRDKIVI